MEDCVILLNGTWKAIQQHTLQTTTTELPKTYSSKSHQCIKSPVLYQISYLFFFFFKSWALVARPCMMTHHIKNNTQKTLELQKKIYLALCLIKPVETDAFYAPLLKVEYNEITARQSQTGTTTWLDLLQINRGLISRTCISRKPSETFFCFVLFFLLNMRSLKYPRYNEKNITTIWKKRQINKMHDKLQFWMKPHAMFTFSWVLTNRGFKKYWWIKEPFYPVAIY